MMKYLSIEMLTSVKKSTTYIPMKKKILTLNPSLAGMICTGAILLTAGGASAQNIFVSNWFAPGAIYEIMPGGSPSTFYSGGLGEPLSLAFSGSGNLFVANSLNGAVYQITPGGSLTTFASGLSDAHGLAFNSTGHLFVGDYNTGTIYSYTSGGVQSTFATGLSNPLGLAFNSAGDLFEADGGSGNIYEFTPGGARTTFASGLSNPYGLAFNSTGNLFVSVSSGISEFTPAGIQTPFVGVAGIDDMAFDNAGNMFATGNGNLVEFAPGGQEQTIATSLGNSTGIAIQGLSLPVPEPSTLALAGLGMAGLLAFRRREKQQHV
jgi:sugar lactone lactonase YvrE